MLQAHPSVITSRDHCAQLLGHEASRVLHDRLTNDADRQYFHRVLSEQLHNGFKTRWSAEELEKKPLIFGDFLEGSEPHSPRVYRSVRQYDRLPQILEVGFALNPLTSRSDEYNIPLYYSYIIPETGNKDTQNYQEGVANLLQCISTVLFGRMRF